MASDGALTFFLEAERDPPELVEVQRRHIEVPPKEPS